MAHHLLRSGLTARGEKPPDNKTVPLCYRHHHELHMIGDENRFWVVNGIDPYVWADTHFREWSDGC